MPSIVNQALQATGLDSIARRFGFGSGSGALELMRGRSDPSLSCFWNIELPNIPNYTGQGSIVDQAAGVVGTINDAASWVGSNTAGFAQSAGKAVSAIASPISGGISAVQNVMNSWNIKPAGQVSLRSEFVESVTMPFANYGVREVYRGGVMLKYPALSREIGDLEISFYVGDDNESHRYIQAWLASIQVSNGIDSMFSFRSTSGYFRPAHQYKQTITVLLQKSSTPSNFLSQAVEWVTGDYIYKMDFEGCWPKHVSDIELDASGERLVYHVTFSVDDIKTYGFQYVSLVDQAINAAASGITGLAGRATTAIAGSAGFLGK